MSGRSTQIKSLHAQDTGVGGEQPLLGIVFASQADVWPYSMYVSSFSPVTGNLFLLESDGFQFEFLLMH